MHIEDDVDRVLFAVAVNLRFDLDKGVTAIAECVGEHRDRVLELLSVVPIAGLHGQQRQHRLARQIFQPDTDVHLAEPVALALLDREGDHKAIAVRGQFGHRRDDPEIGVALGQIEFAQQLTVVGEPIRVVGIGGRQKAVPPALLGFDRAAQGAVGEHPVANEIDAAHAGRLALVDLEDEVDPVFRQLDDLRLDGRGKAAAAAVELEDPPDVVLHPGAGINDARTQLDLGIEILVGQLRVTLEGDAVDDRVLEHPDDQRVAFPGQLHIGEEPGREEGLQRSVDPLGIPRVAGLEQQIGAHRLGLDPLDALDPDIADRAARGGSRGGPRLRRRRQYPGRRRDQSSGQHGKPANGHAFWQQNPHPRGL